MQTTLPAVRIGDYALVTVTRAADSIRPLVRQTSPTLTNACIAAGFPVELAELCGGLLASVVEDLVEIGKLRRTDFERSKRKERVLQAAQEPARSALRIAIAASPINGRAAVSHWDAICDQPEQGKLAWLLGLDTEAAYNYGRRYNKRLARA